MLTAEAWFEKRLVVATLWLLFAIFLAPRKVGIKFIVVG